jgi:hypothetical protein
VPLNSTNSTSGLIEPIQSEAPETNAPFVSHVSQQEKESDPQDFPSNSQEKENLPSEQNDSQVSVAEAVPSSEQNDSQSKIIQAVPPTKQLHSQSQDTEAIPSLRQNDSQNQITEAILSLEQNDSPSQNTGATPSLEQNDSPSQHTEATPSLGQNDSESQNTEATPSPQQTNSPSQITLVAREGDIEAFAADHDLIPGISDEGRLSITSQPEEFNTILPDETIIDHHLTVSRNDWGAMALARVQAAIWRLSEKREALLGMRVKVQESRNSARRKRLALADLNAQILQDVQKRTALGFSDASTPSSELLLKLQEALEELQVSEAELNATEDLLNRKEWELKEAEVVVYQSRDFERANPLAADSSSYIEEEIVETASDSTLGGQPARSPLEKQYLSRKGDADMLSEELDGLRAQRAYLVEEERSRQAMGMSLDAESQRFLENFNVRHDQLQQDLFYAQEDIFRLQTMLSNAQDDALYTAGHFDLSQIDDGLLSDDGVIPDPLLLNIEAPSPGFSNVALDFDQSNLSTVDYINEWLLHRLRRSPLEILLFKSELQNMHLDSEQLKDLVLEWWPRDDTSKIYSEARRRSRRNFSYNARSRRPNLSTQAARSDSVIHYVNRLGHRSQRGALLTPRNRSSVTLDRLINNLTLHRPSTASSV